MYTIIKAQIYQTGKRIKEIVTEHETGYFKRKKCPSGIIINDWLTIQVSICTYLSKSPSVHICLSKSPSVRICLSKSPSLFHCLLLFKHYLSIWLYTHTHISLSLIWQSFTISHSNIISFFCLLIFLVFDDNKYDFDANYLIYDASKRNDFQYLFLWPLNQSFVAAVACVMASLRSQRFMFLSSK